MKNYIESEVVQFHSVFPTHLNSNSSLFGGYILKWMDELAFICASRFTHQKMFTRKSSDTKFLKMVESGSILELKAKVDKIDSYKLIVLVDVYSEKICSGYREKVASSNFELVALDDNNKLEKLRTADELLLN